MKLLPVFLGAGVSALQCHTCTLLGGEETTHENCPLVECPDNGQEYSCQNEARNHHGVYWVKKGCKQRQACENNQKNNWMKSGPRTQCDPSSTTNSVCRCCCEEDNCNTEDIFCAKDLQSSCGVPNLPEGLQTVCDNFDYSGSICRFTCADENRLLRGAAEMKCDGENWVSDTNEEPFCEATCPLPNIKDGALSGSCSDPASGSVVCDFDCPPLGYRMEGPSRVQCLRDVKANVAFWESEIPKCIRVTCPALVKLENGTATCTGNKFEDTCQFECNDGYFLEGFSSLQCLGSQRWSGQYPKCVKKVEAFSKESPEEITSATPNRLVVMPITTTKTPERRIITSLTRIQEATPANIITTTKKVTTTRKTTTTIKTTTTTRRPTTTTRRTTTQFQRRAPSPTRRIVIFPEQTARPTLIPTTRRIKSPRPMPECPDLVHAATKKVCTSGLFVGSTCEFSCPEGYKIDGPTSATCLADLQWSNKMPDCTFKVRCEFESDEDIISTLERDKFNFAPCSKVMVERWIVDEAMKLDSNWSKYFHYNPADWAVSGRTNELIEEWIEVDITAGCPTEEMMGELEEMLYEKGTEADWRSVDAALLANNCRPTNPQ